jgi:GNAT superfamily N-acetyltransferase
MVKLVPMNEPEFEMYLQYTMQEYAQDQAQSGRESEDEGLQEAEQQYHQLLLQGLQTPGHSLCMIMDEARNKHVGVLWFDQRELAAGRQVFVNDIFIFEEFRRSGYAQWAMQQLEKQAVELGATSIGLRILGQNEAAHTLYEKLHYNVASIDMSKSL